MNKCIEKQKVHISEYSNVLTSDGTDSDKCERTFMTLSLDCDLTLAYHAIRPSHGRSASTIPRTSLGT